MDFVKKYGHWLLVAFVCFVFMQSLFFKYTGSPETDYIFVEKLNGWSKDSFGVELFGYTGIFGAYVIGTAELIVSAILIAGAVSGQHWLLALGGLGGVAIMSGAIGFHLFTPLGVSVRNEDGTFDGGALFTMACIVWASCLGLAVWKAPHLLRLLGLAPKTVGAT